MNKQAGFTLAESFVAVAAGITAAMLLYGQWQYTEVSKRDTARKIAINTIHYYLEETYFKQNKSYPSLLTAQDLTSINEELISDPYGKKIGDQSSDLQYVAGSCTVDACGRYELRADLEKEDDFVRTNR